MLDEPTSSIDEESSLLIWEILKEIANDKLVIVSSHEVNSIKSYANGIMDLDNKEVVIQVMNLKNMDSKTNYATDKFVLWTQKKKEIQI